MKVEVRMVRYVLHQFFLEGIQFDTDDVPELDGMSAAEIEEYIRENLWEMALPKSAENVYHDCETLGESLAQQSEYKERFLDLYPDREFPTAEYPKKDYTITIQDTEKKES